MKKILAILFVLFTSFVVSSCGTNNTNNDVPSFMGYNIEIGTIDSYDVNIKPKKRKLNDSLSDTPTEVVDSMIMSTSMYANKGEHLFITLRFENEQRDSLVDILINDSDYGDNQVYNSTSKINIVYSIETFKLDDLWVTDILIVTPITKAKAGTTRSIEIVEVNFLRDVIHSTVSASFKKCESQTLKVNIVEEYVPSSKVFFEYEEFEYGEDSGLIITGVNTDFYRGIIYIPEEIDGLKVIAINEFILIDFKIKNLIYPSTLRYFKDRAFNHVVSHDFICLSQELTNIGIGDNWFQGKAEGTNIYLYRSLIPQFSDWFYDKSINPYGKTYILDDLDDLPVF